MQDCSNEEESKSQSEPGDEAAEDLIVAERGDNREAAVAGFE